MAGDQAARGRDRWPRGSLPPVVRPSGQHDPLLHRQAQEVVPHVQELRYHQHLEFQMDLRRDQRLRSIETLYIYIYTRTCISHARNDRDLLRRRYEEDLGSLPLYAPWPISRTPCKLFSFPSCENVRPFLLVELVEIE